MTRASQPHRLRTHAPVALIVSLVLATAACGGAAAPTAAGASSPPSIGTPIVAGTTQSSTTMTAAGPGPGSACALPKCLSDALTTLVSACEAQGACVSETDSNNSKNTCFANGVRTYIQRKGDGSSAVERVTNTDGTSTCFSMEADVDQATKTVTDVIFYGPSSELVANIGTNANGDTIITCANQAPVTLPAACNTNMATMSTNVMASASGATCSVGTCNVANESTMPTTTTAPAGPMSAPVPSGAVPASQIDARLIGTWSVGTAYFYADGGAEGQSVDSMRGQVLQLGADGQFAFAGAAGTWGVAPIVESDWVRWNLAYDLPTKIVLTNAAGQTLDGPVEEIVPGKVDALWIISRVQSPTPGRIWLDLGRAGGNTKR